MTIQNQDATASLVESLLAGTAKHFSNASSLAFGGSTFTVAGLTTILQNVAALLAAVSEAKVAYQAAVKAKDAQMPGLLVTVHAYVSFVRATFGNSPDALADFGLLPHKQAAPLTVAEKAASVAKNLATRAARHTLGKKEKDAIKGTVPATATTTPAITK